MNTEQIAIREKINEARAKQRKYGCWEAQLAFRIQRYIREQSLLEDKIVGLEYDYALATKEQTMAESDKMHQIKQFLLRIGL